MEVNAQGDLVLSIEGGEVVMRRPLVYQEVAGKQKEIASGYVLDGKDRASFQIAAYDAQLPLVIDPVSVVYSGFVGGIGPDQANSIAVDSTGAA